MKSVSLPAMAICLGLSAAAADEWVGRVVDMGRSGLVGAKVTLHPLGITAVTDGTGTYRFTGISGLGERPARPGYAGGPLGGLRLGFQVAAELPARDITGRRWRPEGSRWAFIAPLPPPQAAAPAPPLAKGGVFTLTAEKTGYQTATLDPADGNALPDIVLAGGRDWSGPVTGLTIPRIALRIAPFSLGGTSTDIPNITQLPKAAANAGPYRLSWMARSESGVSIFVRPHDYVPKRPESVRDIREDGNSGDSGLVRLMVEEAPDALDNPDPGSRWGRYVNVLLAKPAPAREGYGSMVWLHFQGPIPAVRKLLGDSAAFENRRALFTGEFPRLETCGRLAGKVAWRGPGPFPELWVGMAGTDLLTRVAADGTFRTGDLPAGTPPLAVVRVARDADGRIGARSFHPLDGVTILPAQTAFLDSIVLSAE